MDRQRIELAEFHKRCKEQGTSQGDIAFKCPSCGTVQSARSLIRAGAGRDFAAVEKYLGFSCVGRFAKGTGCDWTLGGLFKLHTLEITTPDGKHHPSFELATAEEARKLAAEFPSG